MSERVDLYDSNRQPLNMTADRKAPLTHGQYLVVVHAILINPDGQVLIQKRVGTKSLWPNLWDLSCSGAITAGETSSQGLSREIKEELGLDIDLAQVPPTLTASFESGFSDYYVVDVDLKLADITTEPKEIQGVKWVSQRELLDLIDQRDFVPYDKYFIQALFSLHQNQSEIHPNA